MSSNSAITASPRRALPPPTVKIKRPPYRAAKAFYLTLLIAACLLAFALLRQPSAYPAVPIEQTIIHRRTLKESNSEDDECRLVHKSKDQCSFVKKHCPTQDAGFAAYLDLYYCSLAHVKPVAFTILISWLGLLFSTIGIAASDFFCINLSTLASILGMSESIAGVTFLAFGNGSPDVFSTFAAMSSNSGDLAVGELFGAATFITAVVAGSMALIRPFQVPRRSFIRDVGFFTVASCFNIFFLWDGKLHFWECIVMIAYYLVYVTSVVGWHWYKGRRRRKRMAEAAARSAFVPSLHDTDIDHQGYSDDGEDAGIRSRASTFGAHSEDWSALERGGDMTGDEDDEEEEEEARERWMSELSANMRLTRPTRSRKNTVTPVRPSLVGALEFQAVLKSLQKSRNIQTIPMHSRRYSDDPSFTTLQQQDQMSTISDPAARPPVEVTVHPATTPTLERPNLDVPRTGGITRNRAVSANDVSTLGADVNLRRRPSTSRGDADNTVNTADWAKAQHQPHSPVDIPSRRGSLRPETPVVEVSMATPGPNTFFPEPVRSQSPDKLAPPDLIAPIVHDRPSTPRSILRRPSDPAVDRPDPIKVPSSRDLPKIIIPRERSRSRSRHGGSFSSRHGGSITSTPQLSPFPNFHDGGTPRSTRPPSIYLPDNANIISPESSEDGPFDNPPKKRLRWWPYSVLPPPGILISTLFPTIYHWHEKTWWEKLLGIIAAPSVFCLTVTLPVVENEKLDASETIPNELSLDSQRSRQANSTAGQSGAGGLHAVTIQVNSDHQHKQGEIHTVSEQTPLLPSQPIVSEPQEMPDNFQLPSPEPWNRWLTMVQAVLAPILCVFSIWIQSPTPLGLQWLIKPLMVCGGVSVVLLLALLATTTPTHRPDAYRAILSIAGFVVSIAWISVIAAQVVGALKALAVILNMSHAIMGLTIFAVGNSLSDLIADMTVAKLGFPVMALSACFGGPMLNILLGIGVSGGYILLTRAEDKHEKHPKKPLHFSTYPIEVSNTLLVSGATLLITLVGLLIFVPLNKWVMSKRIGWTLIALWSVSTVANVVMEVMGVGAKTSAEA